MYISKRGLLLLLLLIGLGGGGYFFLNNTSLSAQEGASNNAVDAAATDGTLSAIAIQPARAALDAVSASGHIALVAQLVVAPEVGGKVQTIDVAVGDFVNEGDLLLSLDTVELERALKRAELSVEAQRNSLAELTEEATDAELAVARANLAEAEQNLADVKLGPSDAELAAARSSVSSSWARYNELQAGPTQAELVQLSADLKKSEIALAEARRAYDRVVWRNDIGMTSEAAALQDATIDYERAQAAYEVSVADANTSDVQSAISSAQSAQAQLNDLLNSPTAAEIAQAEAQVADAEAALAELLQGPTVTALRSAEISLEQALVDLEEAHAHLAATKVYAPATGTVLAIAAGLGERVSEGAAIVTLADTSQLELTIDVAELDVPQVTIGQPASVEIDALAGQTLRGEVVSIAPSSDSTSGVIYYPVTIRLTDDELVNVRPGMTAVATLRSRQATTENGWLVPTTAITEVNGQSIITVVDGEITRQVVVETGAVRGEWTVVQSTELAAGDQVQGSLASFTNNQNNNRFGPPGGGPRGQ